MPTEMTDQDGRVQLIHVTLEEIHLAQTIRRLIGRGGIFLGNAWTLDQKGKKNYYAIRIQFQGEVREFKSDRPWPYDIPAREHHV